MPRVERSVLVHYSAEQMFELVAGIEDYPRFLPWCSGASVVADGGGGVDASVDIDYRGIRSRFTTRNLMRFPEQIKMTLLDGPFQLARRQLAVPRAASGCLQDATRAALQVHQ